MSRVVLLSGGIGGAKLALGFDRLLPRGALTVIANVGDDFDHLGLRICPDIDTLLYTLSDQADGEQGWGRRDESWTFMAVTRSLGGEDWFALGDGDLALHVARTRALGAGESLTAFTAGVTDRWNIASRILPVTDDRLATRVITSEGELAFQDYFVRRSCAPAVRSLRFDGATEAKLSDAARAAISAADAIIVAPSNPYLSIDPILAVSGLREALRQAAVPVVAVCPIIGGEAVKGPTAKIMRELGLEPGAEAIARHYADVIDGLMFDAADAAQAAEIDVPTATAATLMLTLVDRTRLAGEALQFALRLSRRDRGAA